MAKAKRRDPQAKRAYEWERSFGDWNVGSQPLSCLKKVINTASEMFRVRPPAKVERQKGQAYSVYKPRREIIRLIKRHHNVSTALHEVAHHITYKLYGKKHQHHGKEWLGIYADLLVTFKVAPADAVYPSLRSRGLKFIKVNTTNKKARKH